MRIDAHQHFWQYNPTDYPWMTSEHQILKQDYLPKYLHPFLRDNGFAGSVAVQARQSLQETEYLAELARENDFIKGVVGWVDLTAPNLLAVLAKHQENMCGVRHLIHDEPDVDYMLRDDVKRGIGFLSDYQLTFDLLIRPQHLANTITLVDTFPNQAFVVDHIAKPDIAGGVIEPWGAQISELARRENVFCKVSGMVTEADSSDWNEEELPLEPFAPFLDIVLEAFTPSRLMFGSDWPVCTLAATYEEVYDVVAESILSLSTAEQEDIMGGTATRFYGLQP